MVSMTKTQYSEARTRIASRITTLLTEFVQLEAKWIWTGFATKLPANKPVAVKVAATARRGRPLTSPRVARTVARSNGKAKGPTMSDGLLETVRRTGPAGIAKEVLIKAWSSKARPNHIGIAIQRHLRGNRIVERGGKFYVATTTRSVGRQPSASTITQPTA